MTRGLVLPPGALESLLGTGLTVSVAPVGTLGGLCSVSPALMFTRSRLVRAGCAFVRAIHELFWAVLFLQVFGLSALTALLALAVPLRRHLRQGLRGDPRADARAAPGLSRRRPAGAFVYAELLAWARMAAYTRYRFECALRQRAARLRRRPTWASTSKPPFAKDATLEAGAFAAALLICRIASPFLVGITAGLSSLLVVVSVARPFAERDFRRLLWRFVSTDIRWCRCSPATGPPRE
ncbi:hypothetical protein DSL92_01540 [Billgrantia gudaonensis]|uniref:Uncharacterized protein n=1 Tax=Billgrantia gudaonensis TaxID=376427 RepID=A0A432JKP3_9GAMM|nr:hypothetical protein DSL92_01540 [Halomonas gudaonensis]